MKATHGLLASDGTKGFDVPHRYDVEGYPEGRSAFIQNVAPREWMIQHLRNGVLDDSSGGYLCAEDALAALRLEYDAEQARSLYKGVKIELRPLKLQEQKGWLPDFDLIEFGSGRKTEHRNKSGALPTREMAESVALDIAHRIVDEK